MDILLVITSQKGTMYHPIENLLAGERILTGLGQALKTRSDARLIVQCTTIRNTIYQVCCSKVSQDTFQKGHIAQVQPFGNLLAGPARSRVLVKESQEA
jgi:hypothetical protein